MDKAVSEQNDLAKSWEGKGREGFPGIARSQMDGCLRCLSPYQNQHWPPDCPSIPQSLPVKGSS